jgi:hypothetical protein
MTNFFIDFFQKFEKGLSLECEMQDISEEIMSGKYFDIISEILKKLDSELSSNTEKNIFDQTDQHDEEKAKKIFFKDIIMVQL